jgi:hypothetical protein
MYITNITIYINRLFGGMLRDIADRAPEYKSDFTDALNYRCIPAVVFLLVASVANAITFGGVLRLAYPQ